MCSTNSVVNAALLVSLACYKQVMLLTQFVGLLVCLSVRLLKELWVNFSEFFGRGEHSGVIQAP